MDIQPDQYFYARNESIITDLSDLKSALENMDDDSYNHHVTDERNDFSEWIKHVIGDKKLANSLLHSKSKKEAISMIDKKLEKSQKKEKAVESVESEIVKRVPKKKKRKKKKVETAIDIPLEKFDEIIAREKEIEKREEKIQEIEERIETQLGEMKKSKFKQDQPRKFFTKEFIQGIVVGILLCVILFLVYYKFVV